MGLDCNTNLVGASVIVIFCKEAGKGGNGFLEEGEGGILSGVEVTEGFGKRVRNVSAVNTIVDCSQDLGCGRDPQLARDAGGIVGGEETVAEKFLNAVDGCVGHSALSGVREIGDLEGVGDGDWMRGGEGFSNRDGEVPIGDGHRGFSDSWDVRIHAVPHVTWFAQGDIVALNESKVWGKASSERKGV